MNDALFDWPVWTITWTIPTGILIGTVHHPLHEFIIGTIGLLAMLATGEYANVFDDAKTDMTDT